MSETKSNDDVLDKIAKILLRAAALGLMLLLIWVMGYAFARDVFYEQGRLFGLTPHELDVIHYCGMAFLKTIVLLFFVFPYIAIRLVINKQARATVTAARLVAKKS